MTIKILLVDDELAARSNIKLLLSESSMYEIVADFSDPVQALAWLEENLVQIIISDMNMPRMSGVEFIRFARALNPNVQMIAISGYDDYDYLRECMRTGVHDYLLKHKLTSEQLINVLDNLRHTAFSALKEEVGAVAKSDIMRSIFEAECFDKTRAHALIQENGVFIDTTCMIVIVLNPDPEPSRPDHGGADRIGFALSDIACQVVADSYKHMEYISGDNSVVLLLSFAKVASYQYIISVTGSAVSRIRNMARRLLGLTLSVGMGTIARDLDEAVAQYHHLRSMMQQRLYLGGGRTYHSADRQGTAVGQYHLPDEMVSRIAFELEAGHSEDLNKLLEQTFAAVKQANCSKQHLIALCKRLIAIVQPQDFSEGDFARFTFYEQFHERVFAVFAQAERRRREQQAYSPQAEQVVRYIETHYAQPISLEDCAEHIGVSYTHMSRIFSRETGKRFAEYLNQVRIEKAKALILQGEMKMKNIVTQAGFNNYNYFFKVFKELEGVTPNEFLAQSKKME